LRRDADARPPGAEHDVDGNRPQRRAGKGAGVFQGQIRVAQIAQKTDAQMACNTLLLSDDGEFAPSRSWRSSPTT
jgi:heme A synthase